MLFHFDVDTFVHINIWKKIDNIAMVNEGVI